MTFGKFVTKRNLVAACAAASALSVRAQAPSTLTIAQFAVADLQQSTDALTAETRDLPLPGEVINLYNPNSRLAPSGIASSTFTASASDGAATPTIVLPPTRSPITPGTDLPRDVSGYSIRKLDSAPFPTAELFAITGGQSAGFLQDASGTNVHAAYWSSPTAPVTDLHPTNGKYTASRITGAGGAQLVGAGTFSSGTRDHAMLWTVGQGTNSVDLNPTGFITSTAKATSGVLQVGLGYVTVFSGSHALAWAGTAGSFTDLNPLTFFSSEALGISGNTIVGDGAFFDASGVELHAFVWNGLNQTPFDIHPTNLTFNDSRAVTISGTVAGGYGTETTSGSSHALYWSSLSGISAVDLTPRGYFDAQVTAVTPALQVGFGHVSNDINSLHALLWTGSAGNYLDLNQYLPSYYTNAMAESIDANGNVAGFAFNSVTSAYEPIVWSPIAAVPEPGSVAILSLLELGLGRRRRRV